MELLDASVGSEIWIMMRGDRELFGILKGFDDYINIVLENPKEYSTGICVMEIPGTILLNGSNIVGISPGSRSERID